MVSRFDYAEMQMRNYELYLAMQEKGANTKEIENQRFELSSCLASMEVRDPEEARCGMEIFERELQRKFG